MQNNNNDLEKYLFFYKRWCKENKVKPQDFNTFKFYTSLVSKGIISIHEVNIFLEDGKLFYPIY